MRIALTLSLLTLGASAIRLRAPPTSRRCALAALGAVSATGVVRLAAIADYGEGANQKLPALLPSPIRPTGTMAETCEVVALGREDVCLEPKKLLSVYDALQLEKASATLDEQIGYGDARLAFQGYLQTVRRLVPLASSSDFDGMAANAQPLKEMCEYLDGATMGDVKQKERARIVRKAAGTLASACKARDASPAARAVVSIAKGLVEFADSYA